jgi:hypothetical protein
MSFANLSSGQLRQLVTLVKEKESLQSRLARIDDLLEKLSGAVGTQARHGSTKGSTRRRRKALKAPLLKALQAAGKDGITVKDLAVQLKAKPASVGVWFYTTGKKIKAIKKVGRGRFAYLGTVKR